MQPPLRSRIHVGRVDAVDTRIHLIDQVFFDVARQVDWTRWPARVGAPSMVRCRLSAAAELSDERRRSPSTRSRHATESTPSKLSRDVNRQLQTRSCSDYAMVQEFRVAMLRLCQAQLATGQVSEAEHDAVLGLAARRAPPDLAAALRHDLPADRTTQRPPAAVLHSPLARGQRLTPGSCSSSTCAGSASPAARCPRNATASTTRRPRCSMRYELLRQLVDNTDELSGCCVVVVAAPEFLTDEHRGVGAYQALKLRIHDEVRDRSRDNPYSSLVRLDAVHEPRTVARPTRRSKRCAPASRTTTRLPRSARCRRRSTTASASCSAPSASPTGREPAGGMLIGGGFGAGKSHVLEHLAHLALWRPGFVVSKVVISKETGLHDPAKVFAAAIAEARVPGRVGLGDRRDRHRTATPTRPSTPRCIAGCTATSARSTAASPPPCSCTSTPAATPSSPTGSCASGPATRCRCADLRRRLKEAGAAATYKLAAAKERDLAVQRFRFVPRLITRRRASPAGSSCSTRSS